MILIGLHVIFLFEVQCMLQDKKLNISQIIILIVGVILISNTIIYPPWNYNNKINGMEIIKPIPPSKTGSIFDPPPPESSGIIYGLELDTARLKYQLLLYFVITLAGFAIAGSINMKRTKK